MSKWASAHGQGWPFPLDEFHRADRTKRFITPKLRNNKKNTTSIPFSVTYACIRSRTDSAHRRLSVVCAWAPATLCHRQLFLFYSEYFCRYLHFVFTHLQARSGCSYIGKYPSLFCSVQHQRTIAVFNLFCAFQFPHFLHLRL